MKTFTKESLDKLRKKVYLPDIVEDILEHEKQHVYPTYNCPFHNDSDYNLIINDNRFYCLMCGASGDAIEFLMIYKKLTLIEAIESLADKVGVELESFDDPNLKQSLNHKKSSKIEKFNKIEKLLQELMYNY